MRSKTIRNFSILFVPVCFLFSSCNSLFKAGHDSYVVEVQSDKGHAPEQIVEIQKKKFEKFGISSENVAATVTPSSIKFTISSISAEDTIPILFCIGNSGKLEFWETYENREFFPMIDTVNKVLAALLATDSIEKARFQYEISGLAQKGDSTHKAFLETNPLYSMAGPLFPSVYQDERQQYILREGPCVGRAMAQDTSRVNRYLKMNAVNKCFPSDIRFFWTLKADEGRALELIAAKAMRAPDPESLGGMFITHAEKQFQYSEGPPSISISMTREGAALWKKMTRSNIRRSIAIVLDDRVLSYPTVQSEIPNGMSVISGSFSNEEADNLVAALSAGPRPFDLRIISRQFIPGKEN